MDQPEDQVQILADKLAVARDADVLLINADMERSAAKEVISQVNGRRRRKNLCLFLVTSGGDPGAAFIIGRILQQRYERIFGYVSGYCKSAGTLAMIAAHELVIGDLGDLGPLDIQIAKSDDLVSMNSGLTATTALDELRAESFNSFEKTFLKIMQRSSGNISFRMASEIAANMTVGLFSPIYSQIQAMHLGEVGRANNITREYGVRLERVSENLVPRGLGRLAYSYPSHDFVIDRTEAKLIFRNVRPPEALEQQLFDEMGECAVQPLYEATEDGHSHPEIVDFLSAELPAPENESPEILESEQKQNEADQRASGAEPSQSADERRTLPVSAGQDHDHEPEAVYGGPPGNGIAKSSS
jgi:hypothetical protein